LRYSSYLVWHMPVTGLLKAMAIVLVICWLFPATMPPSVSVHTTLPMTPDQKQLVGVPPAAAVRLLLTLAAVTLIFLAPMNYLWWQALGYFD
jgi:hypothetical protein